MTTAARPVRMIGYIRVSKAREEMISPDLQRKAITAWAKANGRRIVDWLEDLHRTGREFGKRRIAEGITRIAAGEAAEIGVYRFDRWGRNAVESLANIVKVEREGGRVVSVTEPFDAETAVGRYTRTNALALAEMQSDLIGENWRSALDNRLERGLPTDGRQRFGYTYTPRKLGGDGHYHVDPFTGPLLAECYRRYVEGASFHALSRWLGTTGAKPVNAEVWQDRTLRGSLDSGFGAGLIVSDPRGRSGTPSHSQGIQEPVIDEALWQAYRARRAAVAALAPRLRAAATYRLTGLLMCGHCGAPAKHTSNRPGVTGRTLACTRHCHGNRCVPLSTTRLEAEAFVREWLREEWQGTDEAYRIAAREEAARLAARVTDTEALEAELADLGRRLRRALDAYTRGLADEASYVSLSTELQQRIADVQAALDAAAGPARPMTRVVFGRALEAFDAVAPDQANLVLRELVGALIVRRDGLWLVPVWELR